MTRRFAFVALLLVAVTPYLVRGDRNRVGSVPAGAVTVGPQRMAAADKAFSSFGGPEFEADLLGANEVPPVDTDTVGTFEIRFNEDFSAAKFEVRVFGGDQITVAHLHCNAEGVNGPAMVFLFGNVPGGFDVNGELAEFTMTDANITAANANCLASIGRSITNLAELAQAAADGLIYANVHSVAHPGGEIRGQLVSDDDDDQGDDDEDDDEDEDEVDDD